MWVTEQMTLFFKAVQRNRPLQQGSVNRLCIFLRLTLYLNQNRKIADSRLNRQDGGIRKKKKEKKDIKTVARVLHFSHSPRERRRRRPAVPDLISAAADGGQTSDRRRANHMTLFMKRTNRRASSDVRRGGRGRFLPTAPLWLMSPPPPLTPSPLPSRGRNTEGRWNASPH